MSDSFSPRTIGKWSGRHPYLASSLIIAAVTGAAFATNPILHAANLDTLYLLTVLVIALRWGERPAVFTAIVSAIVFDYCFVPPRFSFAMTDLAYLVTLGGFLAVAIVTSRLAGHAHELIREQAARERAEALSTAKDIVLHKVSHELRAPLTAVVGWAQLLREVELDRQPFDRAVSGLGNSAQVLRALVDDLWDASRAASGKLPVEARPMPLQPAVAKALDIALPAAEAKGIVFESALEPAGEILGDEVRIGQIVTNLVSNAIKFTPKEGRITVRLSRSGEEAELVVSDSGAGIQGDFLAHVFDPFSQADPKHSHGGLGLGLSIVKYLVEAHHGTITVSSEGGGRGSTFTVRLPLITAERSTADTLVPATAN